MNQRSSGRPYAQDPEDPVQDSEAAFALGMLAGLVQQSRNQPELLEQTQEPPNIAPAQMKPDVELPATLPQEFWSDQMATSILMLCVSMWKFSPWISTGS
jgi:hypothetical protein